MKCKWHLCEEGPHGSRADFEPTRKTQEFCSDHCRQQRASWRQRRGSTIVDMLMDGRWAELRREREKLTAEINNADPV